MPHNKLNKLKIDCFSVKLRFSENVNFNFFHGAKIYSFVASVINKHPIGSNIVLDLPEMGRLQYCAGEFYNFGINLINTDKNFNEHFVTSFKNASTSSSEINSYPFYYDSLIIKKIPIPVFPNSLSGKAKEINISFLSPLRMLKKERADGSRYFDPQYFDEVRFFELLLLRVYKELLAVKISKEELPELPVLKTLTRTFLWVDMPKNNGTTLGGIIGKVKLYAELNDFWEQLLWLGQFLHAGNNTSFGFGKYLVNNYNLKPSIQPEHSFLKLTLKNYNLTEAFYSVKENKGKPGVDGITLDDYELSLNENLEITKSLIEKDKYKPASLLGVILPVSTSKIRVLAIPTVNDRVFQRAVNQIIGPMIDQLLEESSFAYRKGFSRQGAAKKIVKAYQEGYRYVLESDIESFFDSVNWQILFDKLDVLFFNDPILDIIKKWVKASIIYNNTVIKRTMGLPQGTAISPLLANLYLDEFDEIIQDDFKLIRYADDFVILCKSKKNAESALETAKAALATIKLNIKPSKTQIIDFDSGFQYLGYLFCRSLAIQKESSSNNKKQIIKLDDVEIPKNSWLTLIDSSKIANTKSLSISSENSLKPLFPSQVDYEKIPIYITDRSASVKIDSNNLSVGFETEGKFVNTTIPLKSIHSVIVIGNPYFSLSALKALGRQSIPVFFLDYSGKISLKVDSSSSNYSLWMRQAGLTNNELFCNEFAKTIIAAKINNSYIIAKRLGFENNIIQHLKLYSGKVKSAMDRNQLRGIEGKAANYFFNGMQQVVPKEWNFNNRAKRPPTDAVNAMLSFGYTILHNHIATAVKIVGLNPEISFYHSHAPHHYSLASDLQEEFRHIIDSLVVYLIHKKMVTTTDFTYNNENSLPVLMKKDFKIKFIELVEKRFLKEFLHSGGDETISYRNFFYNQARSILNSVREGKILYTPLRIR